MAWLVKTGTGWSVYNTKLDALRALDAGFPVYEISEGARAASLVPVRVRAGTVVTRTVVVDGELEEDAQAVR